MSGRYPKHADGHALALVEINPLDFIEGFIPPLFPHRSQRKRRALVEEIRLAQRPEQINVRIVRIKPVQGCAESRVLLEIIKGKRRVVRGLDGDRAAL